MTDFAYWMLICSQGGATHILLKRAQVSGGTRLVYLVLKSSQEASVMIYTDKL